MRRDITFTDLVYADDAAVFCATETDLPVILHRFQREALTAGLLPSWRKTKIMNIATGATPAAFVLDQERIEAVDSFVYLGSIVSSSGYCSREVKRRIGLAGSVFKQLERVWRQSRLTLRTKLRVYSACVRSVLLYGSETWTLLKSDANSLRAFDIQCQRKLLGVRWYHRVTNREVMRRADLEDITITIRVRQHSLFGHIRRMDVEAPAHRALRLAVLLRAGWRPGPTWRRRRGRPRRTWLDQLLAGSNLTSVGAWDAAADRGTWRALRPTAGYAS